MGRRHSCVSSHATVPAEVNEYCTTSKSLKPMEATVRTMLSFRNVVYTVPNTSGGEDVKLLNNVSGFAMPGRLTAIMGESGAGKTTLLDVLSNRKTGGTIAGDICINGYPKPDRKTWSRNIGYVEQFDALSSTLTVREVVQFSALMRLNREIWTEGIEGEWRRPILVVYPQFY